MQLTPTAQKLWDFRQVEGQKAWQQVDDMDDDIDELASCQGTESFGYALFEGGYINPEDWVEGEDADRVINAIATLTEFKAILDECCHEM